MVQKREEQTQIHYVIALKLFTELLKNKIRMSYTVFFGKERLYEFIGRTPSVRSVDGFLSLYGDILIYGICVHGNSITV